MPPTRPAARTAAPQADPDRPPCGARVSRAGRAGGFENLGSSIEYPLARHRDECKADLTKRIARPILEMESELDMGEKINGCEGLFPLIDLLKKKGILISVDERLWSQQIRLDELKVKQILRNLLNNAMKYRKNLVEIEFIHEGRFLHISVKDDGKGIGIMHHKKIFESYFQVGDVNEYGFRSHGLGLAGVMVLIEDMGGELFLESDEGKGTKFIVKVPLPED